MTLVLFLSVDVVRLFHSGRRHVTYINLEKRQALLSLEKWRGVFGLAVVLALVYGSSAVSCESCRCSMFCAPMSASVARFELPGVDTALCFVVLPCVR